MTMPQITASQSLDKRCGVPTSIAQSFDCKVAAISCYISEMVQASVNASIGPQYEVTCDLPNGVICNELE